MIKDERKIHILKIAKGIAYKEGLSKLTIRRIAKDANISIGSVYNIVGTKDELIFHLIEDYWENSLQKIIDQAEYSSKNFLDKLEELYVKIKSITKEFHKDWIKDLVGMHMANPEVVGISNKYKKDIEIRIKEILLEDSLIEEKFNENYCTDDLASFIFKNIMILLENDENDLGILKIILEKALY